MKRTACRCVIGLGLLAPSFGCLSPSAMNSILPDSKPRSAQSRAEAKGTILPTDESSEICLSLANDLELAGYSADAVIQYEKARSLDPSQRWISRRLGVLYDQLGEERQALIEFEAALKRTPKDADLLNDVGYCHYNRGRWSQAETYFRKALAVDSKHARANINLGLTLAQQDKYDESSQVFQKVVSPGEAKANIAFVMATQGKRDEAIRGYRDALRAEPGLKMAQEGLNTLENGGKVNLTMGSPANKPERVAPKRPRPETQCAGESCPIKESVPDMSPMTIGPKRTSTTTTVDPGR